MSENAIYNNLCNESVYDRGYKYPSDNELKMIFAASCVESVADRLKQKPEDIYKRMIAVDLIHSYILKHYDVIHTESRENITNDIINVLNIWEKKKHDA